MKFDRKSKLYYILASYYFEQIRQKMHKLLDKIKVRNVED